jgi:hypothetical protein
MSIERRRKTKQMKMVTKKEKLVVLVEVAAMVVVEVVVVVVVVLAEGAEEVPTERVELKEAGMVEGVVAGEGTEVASGQGEEEEGVTLVQQRKIQRKIPSHYPLPAHLPLRPLRPSHVPLHRNPRQQPR